MYSSLGIPGGSRLRHAALFLALLIPGCGSDAPDLSAKAPSWTIGIFMSADNNLDPAASQDLRELLRHGVPEDDVVMVYIDRADPDKYNPAFVPGVTESGESRYLEIRLQEVVDEELLGELNSNDPDTLHDFAKRVLASPSDHHALILWDHGAPTSFGVDEADGGGMNLVQIDLALREDTSDDTSEPLHFDILGVDACLMASARALERFHTHADYYVASAELEPGPGWDYEAFMEHLSEEDMDPRTLASRLVDSYVDYYRRTGKAGSMNAGLIAIEMAMIPDMSAKGASLVASFRAHIAANGWETTFDALQVAVHSSQPYNSRADAPPSVIDAGGYTISLREHALLPDLTQQQAHGYLAALEAATVNFQSLRSESTSRGISVLANDVGATPTVEDNLADVFLDVTDEAIASDDAPPGVSVSLDSLTPGELGTVAAVSYAATDGVGLERVSAGAAILESGGQFAQVLSSFIARQEGTKTVDGSFEFPLGSIALTTETIMGSVDQMGYVFVSGETVYAPARFYRDGLTLDAVLIFNTDQTISGVAIEDALGTWATFEWELMQQLSFDIALLAYRYDLSDVDNIETLVRARHPAADVGVEFLAIDDSRLNVYAAAVDIAGSRTVDVVPVN